MRPAPVAPLAMPGFGTAAVKGKLARGLIDTKMDIVWTTHMRFEKSLLEDQVWQDAKESGCKYLHFGYESGNERVLKLMDKATTTAIMTEHLKRTAEAGIWNHCMGFFGFPGETKEEAWSSVEFLEQNKDYVHSLGFGTFDLGRHNPVAKHPDKWGVTAYKNPDWDLALDYYYTVKNGMSIEEAERVFEQFERNHYSGWDLRLYIREYIFLYIANFGLGKLRDLQYQSMKTAGVTPTTRRAWAGCSWPRPTSGASRSWWPRGSVPAWSWSRPKPNGKPPRPRPSSCANS